MKRKTKIIATVGPASLEYEVFEKIIKAGADFVRINTAYSDEEQHALLAENIKKVSKLKPVQVIFDIRSPEVASNIIQYDPSIIALSFSESSEQVKIVKREIPECKVISKIESTKGVENFTEILDASWGVMVARGDLGKAVSLEKVPCLQKSFSKKTLKEDKFLVIATEMLLSMVKKPHPSRAEVSDVANAVFEKALAVMLSEETAIGRYPVETVSYMRRIIEEAEKCA